MAVNVTYLLGAGASAETLPLVRDLKDGNGAIKKRGFGKSMERQVEILESLPDSIKHSASGKDAIGRLRDLSKKVEKFGSPDIYIRSLWLQGGKNDEIETCKKILSFFLTVEQLGPLEVQIDSRYIPFLASVLERKSRIQFPKNINILTWNYDFQIELALQHFEEIELNKIQGHFGITPSEYPTESPCVIHLNGIAGLMRDNNTSTSFLKANYPKERTEKYDRFLKIYDYLISRYDVNDLFSFAWELGSHQRIESAKKILKNTKILVVIGYSFPFFNREVDNQLITSFIKNNEHNETHDLKIFIQDPGANENQIKFLRERFGIDYEIEIEALVDTSQFFLPPEL